MAIDTWMTVERASLAVVNSLDKCVNAINRHGSRESELIVSLHIVSFVFAYILYTPMK